MQQSVSPKVVIAIVAVVVAILAVFLIRTFNAPTTTAAPGTAGKPMNPYASGGGPTPEQMKQIEEWKKNNPGASTRY